MKACINPSDPADCGCADCERKARAIIAALTEELRESLKPQSIRAALDWRERQLTK